MRTIKVTTKETLDALYNTSALTLEGLAEDSIKDFIEWIKEHSEMTEEVAYTISGKVMNKYCHLTGDNKYPDDLTLVAIPLNFIKDVAAITLPRFEIGGRWFDDIVDNNERREK